MSNAKQLAYALIDALNACGIEEEFSYRFLAEMNDILRKENKELELQNESKKLAGHNKEAQQNIIMLMKEYGLTAIESLELIDKLSKPKPKFKVFANLTDEQKEEMKNIKDPVQMITEAAAKASAEIDYGSLKAHVRYKVASPDYRKQFMQVIDEHEAISDFCEYLIKKNVTLDDVYKAVDEYNNKQSCVSDEEPGDIADVMQSVYTSGEDPGDTHEPSKGSGTPNYERILEKLGWFLDCNENLSHYSLYNEIKDILKEHQEQNKPVEYGTPKDIGNGEYIAPITGVYDKKEKPQTVPLTPKVFDMEQNEGRAYQAMQFKDFAITFMQGDECIKSTDIHDALQDVYLLCEGYELYLNKKRYKISQVLQKQFPSHELIVKVKEVVKGNG